MEPAKYLRVIEKKGKMFIVDINGNPLQPAEAKLVGASLVNTATGKSYVYVGKRQSDGAYKIGRTEDITRRQKELGITFDIVFECDLYGDFSSVKLEAALHRAFEDEWIEGEWFRLTATDISIIQTIRTSPTPIQFLQELESEMELIITELGNQDAAIYWASQAVLLCKWKSSSTRHIAMLYLIRKTREWYLDDGETENAAYMLGIINVVFTFLYKDSL